jgi:hypothetical protein
LSDKPRCCSTAQDAPAEGVTVTGAVDNGVASAETAPHHSVPSVPPEGPDPGPDPFAAGTDRTVELLGTLQISRSWSSYASSWLPHCPSGWPTTHATRPPRSFSTCDERFRCETDCLITSAERDASAPKSRGLLACSRKVLLLCCPISACSSTRSERPKAFRTRSDPSSEPSLPCVCTPVEADASRFFSRTLTTMSAWGRPSDARAGAASQSRSALSNMSSERSAAATSTHASPIEPKVDAPRNFTSSCVITDSCVCWHPRITNRRTAHGAERMSSITRRRY